MVDPDELAASVGSLVDRHQALQKDVAAVHRYLDRLSVPGVDVVEEEPLSLLRRVQMLMNRERRTVAPAVVAVVQARRQIKRMAPETVREIIRVSARHYDCTYDEVIGRSRIGRLIRPRQIAMYLSRKHAQLSYPAIGKLFGRDHSTVQHGYKVVKTALAASDERMMRHVGEIEREVLLPPRVEQPCTCADEALA
jgi:hypothetical protein